MGAELFHTEVRRDMTKLRVAFRNFANAPKITGAVPAPEGQGFVVGCNANLTFHVSNIKSNNNHENRTLIITTVFI
jgi:hypothetical protein